MASSKQRKRNKSAEVPPQPIPATQNAPSTDFASTLAKMTIRERNHWLAVNVILSSIASPEPITEQTGKQIHNTLTKFCGARSKAFWRRARAKSNDVVSGLLPEHERQYLMDELLPSVDRWIAYRKEQLEKNALEQMA